MVMMVVMVVVVVMKDLCKSSSRRWKQHQPHECRQWRHWTMFVLCHGHNAWHWEWFIFLIYLSAKQTCRSWCYELVFSICWNADLDDLNDLDDPDDPDDPDDMMTWWTVSFAYLTVWYTILTNRLLRYYGVVFHHFITNWKWIWLVTFNNFSLKLNEKEISVNYKIICR